MSKKSLFYCNTVDELLAMASMPMSAYPTIASSMRNVELPLDQDDYNWITGSQVHVFQTGETSQRFTRSNLSAPTFSPDDPIIVTGVCVFVYPEPYSTVIEGNTFTPFSSITDAIQTPASPINLRKDAGFLNGLFAAGVQPAGFSDACAAQLDFGGPTWRFIWAFLNAMRLEFKCPNSQLETLMNERLIDIGNSCSRVDFEGLSNAKTPHTFITRRYNQRVPGMTLPTNYATSDGADPPADLGYFVPINCEQLADESIVPNRMTASDAAYGQPNALPAVETWYRLPFPMPMDQNTKIQMYMERNVGDDAYHTRMIDEGVIRQCAGPIPGVNPNFPLLENGAPAIGSAAFTQIPAGMIRIGLGLKGFQVREGACHQFKRAFNDKSLLHQILNGNYAPFAGAADGCRPLGVSGPVDVGSKIIDNHFNSQDAGYVGEED